jgi:hypothetical protein
MTIYRLPAEMQAAQEALEMHLVQAITRCDSNTVRCHLHAALQYCRQLTRTSLVKCPLCGTIGLPERIQRHRCID